MIFNASKYSQWYFAIIANAQSRGLLDGYCEKHHILPRSRGGSDAADNLVILKALEKKRSNAAKLNISAGRRLVWTLRNPSGEVFVIKDLQAFCIKNNLVYPSLIRTVKSKEVVKRGTTKRWIALSKENQ